MVNQDYGVDATHDEQAALLGGGEGSRQRSLAYRLHRHWNQRVSSTWGDIALLFCYPITGLLDSSAIYTWGSFVSMQTGNTVYLGSGIVAPGESDRWLRALISISFFCFGAFAFARFHRYFDGKKRWVIVTSYTLQLIMVIVAAILVQLDPVQSPKGALTGWVIIPIALVAFQSAGQVIISRVLKFQSLTSVVLTSIYCDLFSDVDLFAWPAQNAERNRRLAAPILLLIGAIIGGVWAHSSIGLSGAMWTAVVLKSIVTLSWCLWPEEKDRSAIH